MGIETLDGTSVVASFTHGKHESLCHESTTFVEHSVHGPFCHLARNGSKPTSKGAYDLAHPSPQSEEATIKESPWCSRMFGGQYISPTSLEDKCA